MPSTDHEPSRAQEGIEGAVTVEVICGEPAAECHCSLPPGHEPPHHCQRAGCGGKWLGTYGQPDFDPLVFPGLA